jgi:hypothetical protein
MISFLDSIDDLDESTSDRSRFKDLLSNDSDCELDDDDLERDEYSTTNESKTIIFLNDSIFENDCKSLNVLKSMSN